MANQRMFSKAIIDSDAFLDLPQTAQLLYFHLALQADDDGFVGSPRKIMRTVGCNDEDLSFLAAQKYIIIFKSGIVAIKHWKIHNYIRKDRYKPTVYATEFSALVCDKNGVYSVKGTETLPTCQPTDNQVSTTCQPTDCVSRLGNIRLGESIGECRGESDIPPTAEVAPARTRKKKQFTRPTLEEINEYCRSEREKENGDKNFYINAQSFIDYYKSGGWILSNGKPMKDWKAAVRRWRTRDIEQCKEYKPPSVAKVENTRTPEEKTIEDIPPAVRHLYSSFAEYWAVINQ